MRCGFLKIETYQISTLRNEYTCEHSRSFTSGTFATTPIGYVLVPLFWWTSWIGTQHRRDTSFRSNCLWYRPNICNRWEILGSKDIICIKILVPVCVMLLNFSSISELITIFERNITIFFSYTAARKGYGCETKVSKCIIDYLNKRHAFVRRTTK